MIASIRGEVQAAGAGWVVVSVGGVGFRVEVPTRLSSAHTGTELFLHTQLVVREDALTLFGFSSEAELEAFGILLGVSGVGPRSALGVLSHLTPAEIAAAVMGEDERPFRKVSGIGPKTAKLITVQLAGKIDPLRFGIDESVTGDGQVAADVTENRASANVVVGLVGLGYAEAQAEAAVRDAREVGGGADEAGLLRAALALLQAPRMAGRSTRTDTEASR